MNPDHENSSDQSVWVNSAALQALMFRAGIAVAAIDGSGRLSMLSPGSELLLQQPFAAVPAAQLAEVFHLYCEDGTRLLRTEELPIVQAALGDVVDNVIVMMKIPGTPVRHLRVNATPILGINGEPQGAWAVMTDVTSLVAEGRGELDRTLAEIVNHHLRSPLAVILGHVELVQDHYDDLPPDVVRSLQALGEASQRLDRVMTWISDWIDLACRSRGERS